MSKDDGEIPEIPTGTVEEGAIMNKFVRLHHQQLTQLFVHNLAASEPAPTAEGEGEPDEIPDMEEFDGENLEDEDPVADFMIATRVNSSTHEMNQLFVGGFEEGN